MGESGLHNHPITNLPPTCHQPATNLPSPPPCYHHHHATTTTTMSPLPCYHHQWSTMPPQPPPCHHFHATTTMPPPPPPCHHHPQGPDYDHHLGPAPPAGPVPYPGLPGHRRPARRRGAGARPRLAARGHRLVQQ